MAVSDLPFWKYLGFLLAAVLISVSMHEAGHIMAARSLGLLEESYSIGIKPYVIYGSNQPAHFLIIAVAGSLMNLIMLIFAWLASRRFSGFSFLEIFIRVNVFLLIFNLLPIPGLDGWHILKWFIKYLAN